MVDCYYMVSAHTAPVALLLISNFLPVYNIQRQARPISHYAVRRLCERRQGAVQNVEVECEPKPDSGWLLRHRPDDEQVRWDRQLYWWIIRGNIWLVGNRCGSASNIGLPGAVVTRIWSIWSYLCDVAARHPRRWWVPTKKSRIFLQLFEAMRLRQALMHVRQPLSFDHDTEKGNAVRAADPTIQPDSTNLGLADFGEPNGEFYSCQHIIDLYQFFNYHIFTLGC